MGALVSRAETEKTAITAPEPATPPSPQSPNGFYVNPTDPTPVTFEQIRELGMLGYMPGQEININGPVRLLAYDARSDKALLSSDTLPNSVETLENFGGARELSVRLGPVRTLEDALYRISHGVNYKISTMGFFVRGNLAEELELSSEEEEDASSNQAQEEEPVYQWYFVDWEWLEREPHLCGMRGTDSHGNNYYILARETTTDYLLVQPERSYTVERRRYFDIKQDLDSAMFQ